MTSYQQYETVLQFIKDTWVQTPVFIVDETINVSVPYIVVSSFGVENKSYQCGSIREDTKGYNLMAYDVHRGGVEKLLSDLLDTFNITKIGDIDICGLEQSGPQIKLEEELYEGMITFQVKSYKIN